MLPDSKRQPFTIQHLTPKELGNEKRKESVNVFRKIRQEIETLKLDKTVFIKHSLEWFKLVIKKNFAFLVSNLSKSEFAKVFQNAKYKYNHYDPEYGKMYCFFYDPKGKKDLPYYDRFPLVFIIETYQDGFLGLNLHYLPYKLRLQLFEALEDLKVQNRRISNDRRILINYEILKRTTRFKGYKECLKRYLTNNIQSQIIRIEDEDWLDAIFIPCEKFTGKEQENIWLETEEATRKGYK